MFSSIIHCNSNLEFLEQKVQIIPTVYLITELTFKSLVYPLSEEFKVDGTSLVPIKRDSYFFFFSER